MTIEAETPVKSYTVAGIGPYGVDWPYAAGTLRVSVVLAGVMQEISSGSITVDPASGQSGNVFLSSAAAATYAGLPLIIQRETPDEQGWQAVAGEREAGLEAQLDRGIMTAQELRAAVLGAIRIIGVLKPWIPTEGALPMYQGGAIVNGPTASQIASAAAAAADAIAAAAAAEADAEQTSADRAATAADAEQTGLDRAATAADAEQTSLDRAATVADAEQTNLDRIATGEDREQTGLDREQTGLDRAATEAAAAIAVAIELTGLAGNAGLFLQVNPGATGVLWKKALIIAAGSNASELALTDKAREFLVLSTEAAWRAALGVGDVAGQIAAFAMSTAPAGWLKANGAAVSRTTYSALFAKIGTTWGVGDGSTTFNVPDMRGEFLRGLDDGRSVDAGRTIGSAQSAATNRLAQVESARNPPGEQGYVTIDVPATSAWSPWVGSGRSFDGDDVSMRFHLTGEENRPRNVAHLFCIKF